MKVTYQEKGLLCQWSLEEGENQKRAEQIKDAIFWVNCTALTYKDTFLHAL